MSVLCRNPKTEVSVGSSTRWLVWLLASVASWRMLLATAGGAWAGDTNTVTGRTFATSEQAVASLSEAARAGDTAALAKIFGPAEFEFENPDKAQATNEIVAFATAMAETNRLVWQSPTNGVLEVGKDLWPFPVPLVKGAEGWFFDVTSGKEELLNRRIGENELKTLEAVRAYVEAQREYSSVARKGDEVLEYAQRLRSTPGQQDGLYWPLEVEGEESPLGPLVANAQAEGYELDEHSAKASPEPYYGYYFRILKRQGPHAPVGKYNYVVNGRMIGGFALVAWPARWGQSGVMTFIVNQQGRVYQKNLGPKTSRIASSMKAYDPDPGWTLSPD